RHRGGRCAWNACLEVDRGLDAPRRKWRLQFVIRKIRGVFKGRGWTVGGWNSAATRIADLHREPGDSYIHWCVQFEPEHRTRHHYRARKKAPCRCDLAILAVEKPCFRYQIGQ